MNKKTHVNLIMAFMILIVGCAPHVEVSPTDSLPTQTPLIMSTSTPAIAPTDDPLLANTPSTSSISEEKLFQFPPLSLPEYNARYSPGDLALSPNKQFMAVVSQNKTDGIESVWIWNVQDLNRSLVNYQVNAEKLWSVAFSPDGNNLAIGATEKIIVFDWKTGNILHAIQMPKSEPVQLAFGQNQTIVSSAFNNKVTVWDLSSGEVKYAVEGITGFEPNSFAINPDGTVMVTGAYNGIHLWDFETGQNLDFREEPGGGIGIAPATVFSDTGQFLASTGCSEFVLEGCSLGKIIIWKWDSSNPSVISGPHSGWVKAIAFSPDERTLASTSADSSIELINLSDGKTMEAPSMEIPGQLPPDDYLLIKDILFFPTEGVLAVSTTDGIQLLDTVTKSWTPKLRFMFNLGYLYSITTEGDNLNFRTQPSANGDILRRLHTGEWFAVVDGPILAEDYVWWKVKMEDDTEGWIVEMPGWYEFAQ